jgi:hypothetical protein
MNKSTVQLAELVDIYAHTEEQQAELCAVVRHVLFTLYGLPRKDCQLPNKARIEAAVKEHAQLSAQPQGGLQEGRSGRGKKSKATRQQCMGGHAPGRGDHRDTTMDLIEELDIGLSGPMARSAIEDDYGDV